MARRSGTHGMEWILLEAGMALALAIFIVWWTLPREGKGKADRPGP
jgi:hypothetical protein